MSEPRRQCGNCRLVIRRMKMRRQGSRDGTVRNFQRGPIFKNNARQKLNFTSKSKRYEAAARLFQHFSFVFSEVMPSSAPSRLKKRGVSRTSRYARRDAVDADVSRDERCRRGRRSRVVLAPQGWRQVCGLQIRRRRRQQRLVSGKSSKETVKPSRRECRTERRTCGDLLVCFFPSHTRLRVRLAPGIPCALLLLSRVMSGKARTQFAPRERGVTSSGLFGKVNS